MDLNLDTRSVPAADVPAAQTSGGTSASSPGASRSPTGPTSPTSPSTDPALRAKAVDIQNILQDLILHPESGLAIEPSAASAAAAASTGIGTVAAGNSIGSPRIGVNAGSPGSPRGFPRELLGDGDHEDLHYNPELDSLLRREQAQALLDDRELGLIRRRYKKKNDVSKSGNTAAAAVKIPSVVDKPTIASVVRALQTVQPERKPPPEKPILTPLEGRYDDFNISAKSQPGTTPSDTIRIPKSELSYLRRSLRRSGLAVLQPIRSPRISGGLTPASGSALFPSDGSPRPPTNSERTTPHSPSRKLVKPGGVLTELIIQPPRARQLLIQKLLTKPVSAEISRDPPPALLQSRPPRQSQSHPQAQPSQQ